MARPPLVLIPARMDSSRLPRKMVLPLNGKPLVQWTYETAINAFGKEQVFLLTDSEEIEALARGFGAQVLMTPKECENGTARIQWALKNQLKNNSSEIIIGLQGDEPLLPKKALLMLYKVQSEHTDYVMTTLSKPMNPEDFENPSAVKCVSDKKGRALYFSRSPIPNPGWHKNKRQMPIIARHHVGIYTWSRDFLENELSQLEASPLSLAEDLEQLRILEAGYPIYIVSWNESIPPGVDTLEDLKRVQNLLLKTEAN